MPAEPTRQVYFDYQATAPLDPRVRDAMAPWLDPERVGNPHSGHRFGRAAAGAVEAARAKVAALLDAHPSEILFTSGATEANNLALFGLSRPGWRIVASAIEHPSVLACFPALRDAGRECMETPVDRNGAVDPIALRDLIVPGRTLISVMAANNEIGTIQDLRAIADLAAETDAVLHSDAAQLTASGRLSVKQTGLLALSLSGHKMGGPMGVGALWASRRLALTARMFGGGQQGGRRSGTLPTPLCVGLGMACAVAARPESGEAERIGALADRLFKGLRGLWPSARRNGGDRRLPGCLHVTLPGVDAAEILMELPDIAASTGSACATGEAGPSHVLRATGMSDEEAYASLRFGLGRFTSGDEVDYALTRFAEALRGKDRAALGVKRRLV